MLKNKIKKIPNPPQQKPIPTELSQESIHQIVQGLQQACGSTLIPNREISTNNNHITQDESVKPNYVPKTDNNNYIEEESSMESLIQQSKNKVEQDRLDMMYDELQTPVMVNGIIFLFSITFFQKSLTKYVPSLFSRDGNPKFSGYFVKTLMFGVSFYAITKITKQLSEI